MQLFIFLHNFYSDLQNFDIKRFSCLQIIDQNYINENFNHE